MSLRVSRLTVIAFLSLSTSVAEEFLEIYCEKSASFLAPINSSEHRKYAPDREIDILHLALDVTPDFEKRTVSVKTVIRFRPIAKPLNELNLNAVDLDFSLVTASEAIQAHRNTDQHLIITFVNPIPPDVEVSVTTHHSAEPSQGLYFRTPEMGYKDGETHLFTQGEATEARHWFPCFDAPNELFTSEITCRVPEGMVVLSNGRRMSELKEADTGLVAVRWLQAKPHVNYLISLVAGYFKKIEDQYRDIPMAFHTLPSAIDQAANSFRNTKDMMAYFEKEIGVPYPWAKYDQVCVNDFVAGGMENTSISTLTDRTLFTEATENLRSSDSLVAHELAHQWFGDLVTCKDWSHLWLNEGFATYYDHLYDGYKNGRDSMLYGLHRDASRIIGRSNDTRSIVTRKYDSPDDQFSYLAYAKGSWILHMLRSQLGEDLFRNCIRTYLQRHAYGNVVTEDLNAIIEELSGRSFDQFFDQWVYHAHHPELEASYSWNEKSKLAKISIKQVQKLGPEVLLFNIPLTVRFKSQSGITDREIRVKEQAEDFYFALKEAPEIVRVDPDYTLLAKIKFSVPNKMLEAQLGDTSDVIGRLIAVDQLSSKRNASSVALLQSVLNNDAFHGVRMEAARALRSIHSDVALTALLESTDQPDARVRSEVVKALGKFYREESYDAAGTVLDQEKNPEIMAEAINTLGIFAKPEVSENLLQFLKQDSYRNTLASAAIQAMRRQDNSDFIDPIMDTLRDKEASFPTFGFSRALSALGYLARNNEDKTNVREFLASFTGHAKRNIQLAAIRALGTLGDTRAIPVLETFSSASNENPERRAAEGALRAIRSTRSSSDDLKDLRNDVLELKKNNLDLQDEIDDLKKKFEAQSTQKPRNSQ